MTLEIRDLHTYFTSRRAQVRAVDGVSLRVNAGEVLALVGESGSGKSVTGFSILGLIDPPGKIAGGQILFEGRDLVGLKEREMRRIRGKSIAMIFQDPMMTLNPVMRIDAQMIETIRAHENVPMDIARERACEALTQVGIAHAQERLRAYPHQFSGGMRQRVAIAIALLHDPRLIIADEPTTALDVTIQAQILSIVQKLAAQRQTALLWITHDLSVVAGLADRIAVMYAGKIVESGNVDEVLNAPLHPYTKGLIGSVPNSNKRGARLAQIPGMFSPETRGTGCAFRDRCGLATLLCEEEPPLTAPEVGREVRCFHPSEQLVHG